MKTLAKIGTITDLVVKQKQPKLNFPLVYVEEDVLVSLQREVDELAAEGPNNNENVMEEDTNDFIGKDQGDNHGNLADF